MGPRHDRLPPVAHDPGCCHRGPVQWSRTPDMASASRDGWWPEVEVLEHGPVDDVAPAAFEGSAGFTGSLALLDFLQVVLPAEAFVLDLAHGHDVQHRVQPVIAAGVQSLPQVVPAGGVQGRGAGVAGEVAGRAEPAYVPALAQDLPGQDRADALQFRQGGAGGLEVLSDAPLVVVHELLQSGHLTHQITGKIAAALLDGRAF